MKIGNENEFFCDYLDKLLLKMTIKENSYVKEILLTPQGTNKLIQITSQNPRKFIKDVLAGLYRVAFYKGGLDILRNNTQLIQWFLSHFQQSNIKTENISITIRILRLLLLYDPNFGEYFLFGLTNKQHEESNLLENVSYLLDVLMNVTNDVERYEILFFLTPLFSTIKDVKHARAVLNKVNSIGVLCEIESLMRRVFHEKSRKHKFFTFRRKKSKPSVKKVHKLLLRYNKEILPNQCVESETMYHFRTALSGVQILKNVYLSNCLSTKKISIRNKKEKKLEVEKLESELDKPCCEEPIPFKINVPTSISDSKPSKESSETSVPIPPPPPPPIQLDDQDTVKTVQLRWESINNNDIINNINKTIWNKIEQMSTVDQEQIISLFTIQPPKTKISQSFDQNNPKPTSVIDLKRAQSIAIILKKYPNFKIIENALNSFETDIFDYESIQQLEKIMPTDKEIELLINIDDTSHFGIAEKFMLFINSISHPKERVKILLFILKSTSFKEECEEFLDIWKLAIDEATNSSYLKSFLSIIFNIGNCINRNKTKYGFNIAFIEQLPFVKDTKNKKSLLYHVCDIWAHQNLNNIPPNLFDSFTHIHKAAKTNFSHFKSMLYSLIQDFETCWKMLQQVHTPKIDNCAYLKHCSILNDIMEQIVICETSFKQLENKFINTLLYFGYSHNEATQFQAEIFFRLLSDFSTNIDKEFKQYKSPTSSSENNSPILSIQPNNNNNNNNVLPTNFRIMFSNSTTSECINDMSSPSLLEKDSEKENTNNNEPTELIQTLV